MSHVLCGIMATGSILDLLDAVLIVRTEDDDVWSGTYCSPHDTADRRLVLSDGAVSCSSIEMLQLRPLNHTIHSVGSCVAVLHFVPVNQSVCIRPLPDGRVMFRSVTGRCSLDAKSLQLPGATSRALCLVVLPSLPRLVL